MGDVGLEDWTGEVLEGRYRVDRRLDAGGMATAYLAVDLQEGSTVVVKVPHREMLAQSGFRERFEREVRTHRGLRHSHVVPVLGFGVRDGVPFGVFRFMEGGSLRDLLRRQGGRLGVEDVSAWLAPLAGALDHLHERGLLHRDVKPGNILFDASGTPFLADFGLVKILEGSTHTLTPFGVTPGSPDYMAPEATSTERPTPAYDQYALGVVVYQALTGSLPYQAMGAVALMAAKTMNDPLPITDLLPDLPHVIAAVVMRGIARHPGERFASCTAFATALQAAARGAVHAPRPAGQRAPGWARLGEAQLEAAEAWGIPPAFENGLGMRFVLVPPGEFRMGSPVTEPGRNTDEGLHDVRLTRPCYLAVWPTTNVEYRAFRPDHRPASPEAGAFGGPRQPVVHVTRDDAVAFAAWLSSQDPERHYRLPTEAEWERACRAGTGTPFSCGETISSDLANLDAREAYGRGTPGRFLGRTTDVASFPSNAWGLYDMHGNVWEWCADAYAPYGSGRRVDPVGEPADDGGSQVSMRGGSWFVYPPGARSAVRGRAAAGARDTRVGFRLAVTVACSPPPGRGA